MRLIYPLDNLNKGAVRKMRIARNWLHWLPTTHKRRNDNWIRCKLLCGSGTYFVEGEREDGPAASWGAALLLGPRPLVFRLQLCTTLTAYRADVARRAEQDLALKDGDVPNEFEWLYNRERVLIASGSVVVRAGWRVAPARCQVRSPQGALAAIPVEAVVAAATGVTPEVIEAFGVRFLGCLRSEWWSAPMAYTQADVDAELIRQCAPWLGPADLQPFMG